QRSHIDPAVIPNRHEGALLSPAPPHHHFQAVPRFDSGRPLIGLLIVQILRLDRTGIGGIAGGAVREGRARERQTHHDAERAEQAGGSGERSEDSDAPCQRHSHSPSWTVSVMWTNDDLLRSTVRASFTV